jgi:hypothetical protein
MGTSKGISGGGYESKQTTHTEFRKREPVCNPIDVGAVSRVGSMIGAGTPYKSLYQQGKGYEPKGPAPQKAGPGGGRVVRPSGSQGRH